MSILVKPRGGIPPIASGSAGIADAAFRLAAGHGPIALDTERASSFRYNDRAFIIQAKRNGAGIVLFDVESQPDAIRKYLAPIVNNHHWILHAAANDLPCLAELGLFPSSLFDTELAGRLLGFPKVNLSAMTEEFLGLALKKEHSANDWSVRPLPNSWLNYAALDVELLLELAEAMAEQLDNFGKLEWLEQDCVAIIQLHSRPPRNNKTWLDLKGLSRLKTRQQLAVAQTLWNTREDIGKETDTACSALLSDKTLITIAAELPCTKKHLFALKSCSRWRYDYASEWVAAVCATLASSPQKWPSFKLVHEHRRKREAHSRNQLHDYPAVRSMLSTARQVLGTIAEEYNLQADSLIQPLALRKIIWEVIQTQTVRNPRQLYHQMEMLEVRPWQIHLTFEPLAVLLLDAS